MRWASPTPGSTAASPCSCGSTATRASWSTAARRQSGPRVAAHRAGERGPDPPAARAEACSRRCCRATAARARRPVVRPAPDGTSVFFCRTRGWHHDFLTAGPPAAASRPTWRASTTWRCHSRSTSSTRRRSSIARCLASAARTPRARDARRVVRSRAVGAPDGTSGSRSTSRWSGNDGSELQHVALASDDALAAAHAMRERGVPLLAIPDNYYDDLAVADAAGARRWIEACAGSGPLRRRPARRTLPLLHEVVGTACSSRCSSGAAPTTDTAPRTRPFASPRTTRWALSL